MAEVFELIPLKVVFGVFGLWLAVCYLVSWLSGWRDLGDVYADPGDFRGERFRMRSATLNDVMEYSNCLSFSVDEEGLRMRCSPLFRPGHSPVFVPWAEITVASQKSLFSMRCVFSFTRASGVRLSLKDALAEQLLENARGKYQVKPW